MDPSQARGLAIPRLAGFVEFDHNGPRYGQARHPRNIPDGHDFGRNFQSL
jgi:hypothetical protein